MLKQREARKSARTLVKGWLVCLEEAALCYFLSLLTFLEGWLDCLRLVIHVWLGNDRLHYLIEDVLRVLVDVGHRKNLVVGRDAD